MLIRGGRGEIFNRVVRKGHTEQNLQGVKA